LFSQVGFSDTNLHAFVDFPFFAPFLVEAFLSPYAVSHFFIQLAHSEVWRYEGLP